MIRALIVSSFIATTAFAAPQFFPSQNDLFSLVPGDELEARFRADRNNWDTRLEFDGDPGPTEVTGNVNQPGNLSQLENQRFSFDLSYELATGIATWTITPLTGGGSTSVLTQDIGSFTGTNVVQLFTSGSRGSVTLDNVFYNSASDNLAFPNVDTRPSAEGGPTFAETFLFFGNDADITTADFSLSGNLEFGSFTNNNPSEGSKITAKLRNGFLVPEPASLLLLAIGALAIRRR